MTQVLLGSSFVLADEESIEDQSDDLSDDKNSIKVSWPDVESYFSCGKLDAGLISRYGWGNGVILHIAFKLGHRDDEKQRSGNNSDPEDDSHSIDLELYFPLKCYFSSDVW